MRPVAKEPVLPEHRKELLFRAKEDAERKIIIKYKKEAYDHSHPRNCNSGIWH